MFNSFIFLASGTNGGTGTLAIRVANWCQKRQIQCGFCAYKITNVDNYKSLIEAKAYVSIDEDITYEKQYAKISSYMSDCLILVYTLTDYYKAEKLKRKYGNIKKILLYQVGFSPMPFCSYSNSRTKYVLKKQLLKIANSYYIKKLIECDSFYSMDEQCKHLLESLLSIEIDEERILRLPYDLSVEKKEKLNSRKDQTISTICRMEFPFKGYVVGLIKYFEKIGKQYPDLHLVIIGKGEGEKEIKTLVSRIPENIRERIHIIGNIPYEKLCDILRKTTLYVGMGTTILDAVKYNCLAVVAAAYSMELEVEGLFLEYPTNLGFNSGTYKTTNFDEIVKRVLELTPQEYWNLVEQQRTNAKKIYDVDVFMTKINNIKSDNFLISNSKYWDFRFNLSQWLSRKMGRLIMGRSEERNTGEATKKFVIDTKGGYKNDNAK